MTQYNLNRNGSFTTVTGTGYGNVQLSWSQLEKLIDGNTSSSGISLTGSDVLYIETDLSNRIKIDGINLYTSNGSISGNVYFFYRNTPNSSYTQLTTNVDGTKYYTIIPSPSAPRYLVTVISGASCDIYEYEIFNEDYTVAFGDDGQLYAKYIENSAVGEEGPATSVPIYNNGTGSAPVNAYVCIDWTENAADYYIELSDSMEGPWYSIEDGVVLKSSSTADDYSWYMGEFYNTTVGAGANAEKVIIDNTVLGSGTYVSPIFEMDDSGRSSYFISNITNVSGTSVNYSDDTNGTMRVRSSDTLPIEKDIIFIGYGASTSYIYMADPYTNEVMYPWKGISFTTSSYPYATDVHYRTGRVAIGFFQDRSLTSSDYSRIYIFDKDGNQLYNMTYGNENLIGDRAFEFDYSGGIWVYTTFGNRLYMLTHVDSSLNNLLMEYDPGYDFIIDMSVETDGDGLWYVESSSYSVVHIDSVGAVISSVVLNSPTNIAATSGGGCWVFDSGDVKFYKLSSDGTTQRSVSSGYNSIGYMVPDNADGFWYTHNSSLLHRNSSGVKDIEVVVGDSITSLRAGFSGCAVYSFSGAWVKWVDKESGNISRNYDVSMLSDISDVFIGVMKMNYYSYKKFHINYDLYPRIEDPVWGVGGSLGWKEVNVNGYFLPKNKYHQVEYTLHTNSSGTTPVINEIVMAPTIKISDIPSKSSRDFYIRSSIPSSGNVEDYDARLKCWWGVRDV